MEDRTISTQMEDRVKAGLRLYALLLGLALMIRYF